MRKKKYVAGILFVALLSYVPMQAAGYTKTQKVKYTGFNLYYNGAQKYMGSDLVSIDGTTYVAVRDFCNALGMEVTWDKTTGAMRVTNGSNYTSLLSLQTELRAKDYEIASLKKELENLKKDNETTESTSRGNTSKNYTQTDGTDILGTEITATRKMLEDKYEDYFDDIDFDFNLKLSSSKLKLTISYDTSTEHKAFNKLSSRRVKEFIEEICEDIRDRHDDIVIQGTINYTKTDKDQYEFTYSRKDNISYSIIDGITEGDVEDILEDISSVDIDDYRSSINVRKVAASVSDSDKKVTFKLYLDMSAEAKDIWNKHNGSNNDVALRTDLRNIARDIDDETDYDIVGQIYDYSTNTYIATYEYKDDKLSIYSF